MSSFWQYTVRLVGPLGKKSTLTYDLGEMTEVDFETEAGVAEDAAVAIYDQLIDVTDANINRERLIYKKSDDNTVPDNDNLISEVCQLMCHLNAPAQEEKLVMLRIPSPAAGIFGAKGVLIDPNDADLVAYVAAHAANSLTSDGEAIDVTTGETANGIHSGQLVTIKKEFGK